MTANADEQKKVDETSDNEFQDAEDVEKDLENFVDALDLTEDPEANLTEEELQANKEKAESFKQEGNEVFKKGEYENSIELYTKALSICPKVYKTERSFMYNNRAAAHRHLGAQNVAIEDCTQAVELNPTYVKALVR